MGRTIFMHFFEAHINENSRPEPLKMMGLGSAECPFNVWGIWGVIHVSLNKPCRYGSTYC